MYDETTKLLLEIFEPYKHNGYILYEDFDGIFNGVEPEIRLSFMRMLKNAGLQVLDVFATNIEIPDLLGIALDKEHLKCDWREQYQKGLKAEVSCFTEDFWKYLKSFKPYFFDSENDLDLCRKIQRGDQQAEETLVIRKEHLISEIAKFYLGLFDNDLDTDDLRQSGYIGLLYAAGIYDEGGGLTFQDFATYWIKRAISCEIIRGGYSFRLPFDEFGDIVKAIASHNKNDQCDRYTEEKYTEDNFCGIYYDGDEDEAESWEDESFEELVDMYYKYLDCLSLDTEVGDDELLDLIEDTENPSVEETIIHKDLRNQFSKILENISPLSADVITRRFGFVEGITRTLEEVGKIYNRSRDEVRQIEIDALQAMRHSQKKQLQDFLWD